MSINNDLLLFKNNLLGEYVDFHIVKYYFFKREAKCLLMDIRSKRIFYFIVRGDEFYSSCTLRKSGHDHGPIKGSRLEQRAIKKRRKR